jgi:hypothetical protein
MDNSSRPGRRRRHRPLRAFFSSGERQVPSFIHRARRILRPFRIAQDYSSPSTCSTRPLMSRRSTVRRRLWAMASAEWRPCFKAWLFPLGAPGALPPSIRHRPFAIAGDRHGVPALVRARQRGLRCMGNLLCMGLFLDIAAIPTPRLAGRSHHSDHGCPPAWTWTCSTVTFCWPRQSFRQARSNLASNRFRLPPLRGNKVVVLAHQPFRCTSSPPGALERDRLPVYRG